MKKMMYLLSVVLLFSLYSCDKDDDNQLNINQNETIVDGDANDEKSEIEDESGMHRGKKYIDLGLPSGLKWATMNVGAVDTLDGGDLYRWSAVKTVYEVEDFDNDIYYAPYSLDSINGTEYDVAHVKWGGKWRMPTRDEMEELLENSTLDYRLINEKGGYYITGPNGNSIFLPNTGHITSGIGIDVTYYGYYWTATRCKELRFWKSKQIVIKDGDMMHSMAVRPVFD